MKRAIAQFGKRRGMRKLLNLKMRRHTPLNWGSQFATPHDAADMEAVPVSPLVNSPKNDVPECLAPVERGKIKLEPAPPPKPPKPDQQDFGF
jgi:hypothetical protein